ncbi:MAG: radical SAM protein, partial [Clostridia bacterium]|nr:radical SAM protein [Clostridia bacterium]
AIDDECIEYLKEINERTFLILELGLQTVHDSTAELVNRGHSYDKFLEVYEKLKGLNICIHIINSLPYETEEMMLTTAREIARLHPFMLKIHMLYIEEGTPISEDYKKGDFELLSLEKYVEITCRQLELLPPDVCIGRITGDGQKSTLIAPQWSKKKFVVMNEIDKYLVKNNTYQGILYK